MLRVDPQQQRRLAEIIANLKDRIDEARVTAGSATSKDSRSASPPPRPR
jgi:hypothetical protein